MPYKVWQSPVNYFSNYTLGTQYICAEKLMFHALVIALAQLVQPEVFFFLILGCLIGFTFGIMPGLGGVQGLIIALPFTFGMNSLPAMFLYAGIIGAVPFGGSIPAILMRIPGTAVNICTTFDGYPMTQSGKAPQALGISAMSSMFGGLLSILVLIALLPVVRAVVLAFSPPEFFMLVIWGLCACVIASKGNMVKGLISACIGLIFSFVGLSNVSGVTRYSFGTMLLWQGIPIVPFVVGIFGIGQIIKLSLQGSTQIGEKLVINSRIRDVLEGGKELFKNKVCFVRSALIGTLIGIIPGVGGVTANFVSYLIAMQISKRPQKFGHGAVEGLIASEAANNAKDGGALLTTLSFGIPGSVEMAILLGALTLHGLSPGPLLIRDNLDVVWALIIGLIFSTIFASSVGLVLASRMAAITRIDIKIVIPIVAVLCFVGVIIATDDVLTVFLCLFFGIFSYFMEKFGFSLVTLVMGFVLGGLLETSFHASLQMSFGSYAVFFNRPISLALFCISMLTLSLPFLVPLVKRLVRRQVVK